MKIFNVSSGLFVLVSIVLQACAGEKAGKSSAIPSLKDAFTNDFVIGSAMNAIQIEEKNAAADSLIIRQFNAVTPENIMKAEIIHPEWDKYDFSLADKLVAYTQKHSMQLNAHTLIWHSQLPPFVKQMNNSDSVRQFFVNHINTVAGRYNGKVYSWDVVNEALNEDGSIRKSVFSQKLGDDFVTEAFRLAEKASPNTKLYYNDYNIEQPKKRAGALDIVKKIKAAGVRIDGVGIQGHWHLGKIPLKEIEESIIQFAELGVQVAFTELDIEVLPRNFSGADVGQRMQVSANSNPYKNGLPDSIQEQLANDYEALFRLFLKHKEKISRVTFWGVNDGQSWLNDWPIPGRTNYPLLFDRQFKPKLAFYKVVDTKGK